MKRDMTLTVNGRRHELAVEPRTTLLALLRDQLHLTGTKEGCSTGDCGACTVIMDGVTCTSCLVLALEADGSRITTVEGIAAGGKLHPVQEALVRKGGLQCGFCTPGVVVSAVALLEEQPDPSDEDIRHSLAGNLCRCTGYTKILDAVRDASRRIKRRSARKTAP